MKGQTMPLLFIRARNSEYHARDDGTEYDRPETALAIGIKGAVTMAAEEIGRGDRSTAVEVSVEREDGTCLLSSVVAVSVSPMMIVLGSVIDGVSRPFAAGSGADLTGAPSA